MDKRIFPLNPKRRASRRRRSTSINERERLSRNLQRKSFLERRASGGEVPPLPNRLRSKRCQHVLQWLQRKRVVLGGTAKQDAAFRRTNGVEGKRVKVLAERDEICGHPRAQHRKGVCVECAPWNRHHRLELSAPPKTQTRDAIVLTDSLRDEISDKMRALVRGNDG